ncbi:hypothetical protein REPUB_Repub05bG0112400 [Reevesia pubescens]
MAPSRKSKSVNKQSSGIYEVSPDKDAGNSRKSKPKKKLADKLGPQWSNEENERFYKAYREYGKDWKKVAPAVRNRSTEMMEAIYSMNRVEDVVVHALGRHIGLGLLHQSVSEPDHIFVSPLPNLANGVYPTALPFFYIKPTHNENLLRKFYPEEMGPVTNIDAIGNSPVIIKKDLLKKIAPTWMNVSLTMKDDPEIDKAFGWVLEIEPSELLHCKIFSRLNT